MAVLALVGVSPRHRAAPTLALALSAVRALGAEVCAPTLEAEATVLCLTLLFLRGEGRYPRDPGERRGGEG